MSDSNGENDKEKSWMVSQTFAVLMADARLAQLELRLADLEAEFRKGNVSKILQENRREIAKAVNLMIAGYADKHPNEAAQYSRMLSTWKEKHQL